MINSASGSSRSGSPDAVKAERLRPPKGRRCEEPGCDTVLSTYNAADRCYLHTAPSLRHALYRDRGVELGAPAALGDPHTVLPP